MCIAEINHEEYKPFEGIVLTDTFESTEQEDSLDDSFFGTNDERLKRQQEVPITAIIGNPPYSGGQQSSNDNNENMSYEILDMKIKKTYVENSKSNNNNYSYDSYIRAIRWSSDRLSGQGVIGFVSNASFIDSQSADGLRHSLYNEFNYLYIFNLRGDQRTQGETSRREGGKIFGSGSRTPIAISILVKDGSDNHEIYYHDIGDYLSREEKLSVLSLSKSIQMVEFTQIYPDKNNDWINQRDENYLNYISIYDKKEVNRVFDISTMGVQTKRDRWIFNFGKESLDSNISRMVNNYNSEIKRLSKVDNSLDLINTNEDFIKWSDELKRKFVKGENIENNNNYVISQYRPFTKKWLLYSRDLIARPGKFESWKNDNKLMFITGVGANKQFSTLMTNFIPESALLSNGQGFPMEKILIGGNLFDDRLNLEGNFGLTGIDTFYYIYGLFHSNSYCVLYANDLKKALPRIPEVKNKEKYVEIGKKLADLHLNYEDIPAYEGVNIRFKSDNPSFKVKKMKHPKRAQLDTIIFNEDIVITDIPERAYEYVVNGKPAIEWIIDQYQVKKDKKSGIVDDPNEFSDNPKYIFNLLLSIINVSMQTMDLVESLPPLEIIE